MIRYLFVIVLSVIGLSFSGDVAEAALGEQEKTYFCVATCTHRYFYRSNGGDTRSTWGHIEVDTGDVVVAKDVRGTLLETCTEQILEKFNREKFDRAKSGRGYSFLSKYETYGDYIEANPEEVKVFTNKIDGHYVFRLGQACIEN